MAGYQTIIGMEIHAEVKTASKMFCGCKNDPFGAAQPNIYTCPVCLGMPGALPVPNKKAIEATIMLGLAMGCKINTLSKFDRKHYFYPDLPKGYQISQYDIPFCYDGVVHTSEGDVRIRRVHLEEDTGKLMHDTVNGERMTLIDFNRGGVPLIEIVTEPDIHSASQAKEYSKKLRQIIRYLGISECDMEQGGMRLEANISLARHGATELPEYKTELKNINSFRFMERAISYEIMRQAEILDKGEMPVQETRGYNADKGETFSQRVKETAQDYRYFPDPDIPPIRIGTAWLAAIQKAMPEPLESVFARWQKEYGVSTEDAEQLCEKTSDVQWFDGLLALLKKDGFPADKCVSFLVHKRINVAVSIDSYETVLDAFREAMRVDDVGDDALYAAAKAAIAQNPKTFAEYKAGKTQVMNFFIGQVMKTLQKKLDMQRVEAAVKKALTE